MGVGNRFDDKVVLVTGAGGGLGRAHALMFAELGARVVVNDLGGSAFGGGQSSSAADAVVAEIKEAGGEAVANYDSVEDGARIVQTALDTWGRIDVVVNNAGILRDTTFHKMTEEDWDLIYRVHVLGSYRVTAAAWPHMREQGYGRIIMTSSGAGIYGNFGQANYSMAKLGLYGFASTLALEGARRGIHVNTIAPIAGSRLTETVLPKEITDALRPEFVSPLVGWLCHEDCDETGGLFEVGGGYFAKLRWERSAGQTVRLGRRIDVDTIRSNWDAVTSFETGTDHPTVIAQAMGPVMTNIQAGESLGGNEFIDVDQALGYAFPEDTTEYDERDLALYALGIGAANDPADNRDLQLVYERHSSGFRAFPTFAVIPAMNSMMKRAMDGVTAPGLNYGVERLLHGEQYTEITRPLPAKAQLTHQARVKEIWDKGKGALVNIETESFDENGVSLIKNEFISFIRGAGGWGGDRGPSAEVNVPPDRAPDACIEEVISANQAILYRLSGDWNPLHVDPGFAQAFGFDKPILHGLCTFGYAARHVINQYSGGDPRYFRSIKVRFADSVFPGETLVTRMWQEHDQRIIFECRIKERDAAVLTNAAIELFDEIPTAPAVTEPSAPAEAGAPAAVMSSEDIFAGVAAHLAQNPDIPGQVGKVFCFKLSAPESVWTIDAKNGAGAVNAGTEPKADCVLELSDADFMDMCSGKADPQKLYFGGQLKISGDVMASQKLTFLQKIDPALFEAALAARSSGATESAPTSTEPASADIFLAIRLYVEDNPDLVDRIQTTYLFKLSDPDSSWTIDLKDAPGKVTAGDLGTAQCTLELSESDFLDMTSGKADPQSLYFGGQLKISGDIMASQKLTFLQKVDPHALKARVEELKSSGDVSTETVIADSTPKTAAGPGIFGALKTSAAPEGTAALLFRLTDPDATWTVYPTGDGVHAASGETAEAIAVLTLSDDDLAELAAGNISAQALFQAGRLRIDGDVVSARDLSFLINETSTNQN